MSEKQSEYLYSNQQKTLITLSRRIASATSIALFLDYDGTLTPIRKLPSQAKLSVNAKKILRQLAALKDARISVVTGRSMQNIRKLIGLKNIAYAANHGFHIIHHDGSEWIQRNALLSLPKVQEFHLLVKKTLKNFPGSFVENKHFTLSIHYRNVSPSKVSSLKSAVLELARSFSFFLQITYGKKVIEVRPYASWGKNGAVLELLKVSQPPQKQLSVFIGDDSTDESVFYSLKTSGITIRVGRSSRSAAKYYVRNVGEVLQFLNLLIQIRKSSYKKGLVINCK